MYFKSSNCHKHGHNTWDFDCTFSHQEKNNTFHKGNKNYDPGLLPNHDESRKMIWKIFELFFSEYFPEYQNVSKFKEYYSEEPVR